MDIESTILSIVQSSNSSKNNTTLPKSLYSKKEIIKFVKKTLKKKSTIKTTNDKNSTKSCLKKRNIKHSLKRLVKEGKLQKQDKKYYYSLPQKEKIITTTKDSTIDCIVPVAQQIRQATQNKNIKIVQKKSVTFQDPPESSSLMDIDDEIQRLEAELAQSSSESDDEDEEEGEDDNDDDTINNDDNQNDNDNQYNNKNNLQNNNNNNDANNSTILSFSTLANDRIIPLPTTCLPTAVSKSIKTIDKPKTTTTNTNDNISGLHAVVTDMLQNYQPRSAERIPFYCRVCAKQYTNITEFIQHKSTKFHKYAEKMEQKKTYCKLCRKQLTSPTQMKEHLKSNPHYTKLQQMKQKQKNNFGNIKNNNNNNMMHGKQQQQQRRQWS